MPRTSTFLYSGARKSSSWSSSSSAAGRGRQESDRPGRRGQPLPSQSAPGLARPCQPLTLERAGSRPAQGPTSGEDARVHEGGHAEVGQDKEEEDAIVDRDGWGHGACQPWAPVSDSRAELGLGGGRCVGRGRGAAALGHTRVALMVATGASSNPATPRRLPGTQLPVEETEAQIRAGGVGQSQVLSSHPCWASFLGPLPREGWTQTGG